MNNPSTRKMKVKKSNYFLNFLFSFILAILLLLIAVVIDISLDLTSLQKALGTGVLILLYIILSPLLMRPTIIKEFIPNRNKPKMTPIKRNARIQPPPQKKSDTAKPKYIGHSETRKFHKSDCRLAKGINRKYRETSNSPSFFTNRKYKACKICLKK